MYSNGFTVTPANSNARYSVVANPPRASFRAASLDLATVLFLGAYDRGYGATSDAVTSSIRAEIVTGRCGSMTLRQMRVTELALRAWKRSP